MRIHPSIVEETISFCQALLEHKTIQSKTIRGMLACSETEAHQFIDHSATEEMLEKLDIDNTYLVVKDAVEGFIVILKLNQSIYELTLDENADLASIFKEKIKI